MNTTDEVERLRKFKQESGYSYDRLGKAMDLHYRTIYLWLAGKSKPSNLARKAIRAFLKGRV